ncbi:hypothetical protein KY311_03655, partial [Candidatus Woesearchaeota archaeon]|nr:hypothetical protein [Candidatus Woesearchaeota archaeon]
MHKYQERIVSLFRKEPNKVFSTTDIITELGLENSDGSEKFLNLDHKKQIKREKAKSHRNMLYHLNLLVSEGVLKVAKRGSKGEKHFELNLKQGEELTLGIKKKLIKIAKPQVPEMPIVPFEEKGIVKKSGENWIYKLDSVMFECSLVKSLDEFEAQVEDVFGIVSDVVALNDFDFLFRKNSAKDLIEFCDALELYGKDFRKKFCIMISGFSKELIDFLSEFAAKGYENFAVVFKIDSKSMHDDKAHIERIVKKFSENSISIHLLNTSLKKSPVFFGNFGMYSIDDNDWEIYSQKQKIPCLAV